MASALNKFLSGDCAHESTLFQGRHIATEGLLTAS
jgi:hypothetical protein